MLIVTVILLRFYLQWQNKIRERERQESAEANGDSQHTIFDFKDLTDKENPLFVYVY